MIVQHTRTIDKTTSAPLITGITFIITTSFHASAPPPWPYAQGGQTLPPPSTVFNFSSHYAFYTQIHHVGEMIKLALHVVPFPKGYFLYQTADLGKVKHG